MIYEGFFDSPAVVCVFTDDIWFESSVKTQTTAGSDNF